MPAVVVTPHGRGAHHDPGRRPRRPRPRRPLDRHPRPPAARASCGPTSGTGATAPSGCGASWARAPDPGPDRRERGAGPLVALGRRRRQGGLRAQLRRWAAPGSSTTARSDAFAQREGKALAFPLAPATTLTSRLAPLTRRTLPVVLPVHAAEGGAPSRDTREIEVQAPPGFRLAALPRSGHEPGGEFGEARLEHSRKSDRVLLVRRTLIFRADTVPPEKYASWRAWLQRVDSLMHQSVRFLPARGRVPQGGRQMRPPAGGAGAAGAGGERGAGGRNRQPRGRPGGAVSRGRPSWSRPGAQRPALDAALNLMDRALAGAHAAVRGCPAGRARPPGGSHGGGAGQRGGARARWPIATRRRSPPCARGSSGPTRRRRGYPPSRRRRSPGRPTSWRCTPGTPRRPAPGADGSAACGRRP